MIKVNFTINILILCRVIVIGLFLYGLYMRILAIRDSDYDKRKCFTLDLMIIIGLIGTILTFLLI